MLVAIKRLSKIRKALFPILCFFAVANPIASQEVPVPVELQAAIFKKIFGYNKILQAGQVKVLVVFSDANSGFSEQVVKAFQDAGITASAVKASQLHASIGSGSVVYVTPGVDAPKQVCQESRVLSITGMPSLVETGACSVGLDAIAGKPKILVHMRQLKAEGQELAANLLQLAKIIE